MGKLKITSKIYENTTSNIQDYSQKFPFIQDDVFLIAKIDPWSKKQYLIFQKIDLKTNEVEFSDSLECIHTAITKISYDKYSELMENPDIKQEYIKDTLNSRSMDDNKIEYQEDMDEESGWETYDNEDLDEEEGGGNGKEVIKNSIDDSDTFNLNNENQVKGIELNLDEKFFAFKSWVQGIAEAGSEALRLQSDIDILLDGSIPIAQFLFRNMIRTDSSFVHEYLNKIEKECRFEGVYHKSSLRANLDIILCTINFMDLFDENVPIYAPISEQIREKVIEYLLMIAYLDIEYLFHFDIDGDIDGGRIRAFIASRREFINYPEYKGLFKDNDSSVIWHLINNSEATKFPEYKLFFTHEEEYVREFVAKSLIAVNLVEYKQLFTDSSIRVRRAVAQNQNAVDFPEYKNMFSDKSYTVRRGIMRNPNSKRFEECKLLFPREWGEGQAYLPIVQALKLYSDVTSYHEYRMLFTDEELSVRVEIAKHPLAINFPEYQLLFTDKDTTVREIIARNINAVSLSGYKILLTDESDHIRKIAIDNIQRK